MCKLPRGAGSLRAAVWLWLMAGANASGLGLVATPGAPGTLGAVPGPLDDDAGGWQWEMPDQQELSVGGQVERRCMNCAGTQVVQGVSAAKLQGLWVAFFCKHCAPHLSVRNNAQVPVLWTGPTANVTVPARPASPLFTQIVVCMPERETRVRMDRRRGRRKSDVTWREPRGT
jgi:hypothetical protein